VNADRLAGRASLVGWATFALALASVAALLAPFGWPFELFAHFRWQLAGAALLLVPLALLVLRRRRFVLAAAFACVAAQALPLLVTSLRSAAADRVVAGCAGEPQLRVATLNLQFRNDEHERVLEWLRRHPADIVVLQELTPAWQAVLAGTLDEYPHRFVLTREDPYGIGLLSRVPLEEARAVDFAGDGLPSAIATVRVAGRAVQVIGAHTHWPVLPSLQRARDRGLRNAAKQVQFAAEPSVLAGDLNLTPYAPAFAALLRDSGLQDAFADRRWRPTWRAGFWPLALPIDHVLVPAQACVVAAEVGDDVGSDHRPVYVALRWQQ
jgi:endonuclease/exonuclease/phosphatase (EEP) superfamily protein YafD